MSGFWGYHSIVAAAHGQLGDIGAGRKEIEALLALRPGYTTELVKEDWTIWGMTAVQTEHLAEGLRKAGLPDALPKPSRPVIAVLPFANMSGDPEQAYFADGITEDIITRLAQYPDILVLGRNTTFQFKDQAVDIKTIAEKLGADYIVEGSIRRGGDTVRVTAQLLGAEDGTHHWAETFDRTLTPSNLFAVQDEITIAVANRIADKHGAISVAEAD